MARLGRTRMAGEVFGNYEVVATLGKGGMGVVFLADHQRISRRAAIKVLAPEMTTNPDVVKRFFIEARATSLIRHPGIVEVFDCDVDAEGRAYIVMEYLEGETLAACLCRVDALPWRMACAIGKRVAGAVGAAHERGIIHRDLKPDNVFLSSDAAAVASPGSEVKILDFGIAKLISAEAPAEAITRTGMVLGTPLYIAPEQCGSATDIDHRCDVYSLGCILFEMICGRPPFQREGFRALMMAHMLEPPPLASTLVPEIPAWLDLLIAQMLAKKPDDRPAAMADVTSALARAEEDGVAPPLPISAGVRLTQLLPAARLASKRTTGLKRRGIALAGAVGGLAALTAIGIIALSHAPGGATTAAADVMHDRASTQDVAQNATHRAGQAPPAASAAQREVEASERNARPDVSLASTVETRRQRRASPLSALAPASEPDASSASLGTVPTPSPSPSRRRLAPTTPRLHADSPRVVQPVATDGIVDL